MEIKEKIPIMTYSQYRRARRLVRQCCNYERGNCLALDDGEECVCVQSISYSLLCNWFRAAVLPLDEPLAAALLYRKEQKPCAVCGQPFLPGSNRAKYCKFCAVVHRRQKTASDRKRRAACGQLGKKKP
ncbi:cysteine-rich VLP domain-containing protein [Lacrimispora sp. NSJ-141]|uniref:Cysteine-rich VLP domain-containing protein n=1 Tax=Lientehia hominis TaxID=2897778 RepID=A0AAP2W9I0_9FIRM|nr:cysteine-rich VLP domain-containing protein [Lientehia hominis]MCD2491769.1 cysteine-rich VLP domain-containing protein [Lientehia hominis]